MFWIFTKAPTKIHIYSSNSGQPHTKPQYFCHRKNVLSCNLLSFPIKSSSRLPKKTPKRQRGNIFYSISPCFTRYWWKFSPDALSNDPREIIHWIEHSVPFAFCKLSLDEDIFFLYIFSSLDAAALAKVTIMSWSLKEVPNWTNFTCCIRI